MSTRDDPERRTARTQRDSGGSDEAQKSAGPTSRRQAPAPGGPDRRRGTSAPSKREP